MISIASDHAGFDLKNTLLTLTDFSFVDEGPFTKEPVDYPDYARLVCQKVLSKEATHGVLICASGIGMSIAANRFKGIRAALCAGLEQARLARAHNNANVLVLGANFISSQDAKNALLTFLSTTFDGERHQRRIEKCDQFQN